MTQAPDVLALHGELTIYRASELKQQLVAAAQRGVDLHLDLAGVSEIDTAGVQLLMLARREALAHGGTLRVVERSAAVQEVFDLLDLGAHFEAATPAAA